MIHAVISQKPNQMEGILSPTMISPKCENNVSCLSPSTRPGDLSNQHPAHVLLAPHPSFARKTLSSSPRCPFCTLPIARTWSICSHAVYFAHYPLPERGRYVVEALRCKQLVVHEANPSTAATTPRVFIAQPRLSRQQNHLHRLDDGKCD